MFGGPKRDAELLREPLVKDIPRRKAELGLEQADDAAGAQEEPEARAREVRAEAAAEAGGARIVRN